MDTKLFNIGMRVVSSMGHKEGVIVSYSLRDESFAHRHMYKVQWDNNWLYRPEWVTQSAISEITTN